MDFSKLMEKEIQKKKQKLQQREQKTLDDKSEKKRTNDIVDTKQHEINNKRPKLDHESSDDSSIIPIEPPIETVSAEDRKLLDLYPDEELLAKFKEIKQPPSLSHETKVQAIRRYETFVKRKEKDERYETQLANERAVETNIAPEDIITNKEKVYLQVRVYIKYLLHEWDKSNSEKPDKSQDAILRETKVDLIRLLYKLRAQKLSDSIFTSLSTTIQCLQIQDYKQANDAYIQLSIGNVAWPIGLSSFGIHERSSHRKFTEQGKMANIMIDDKTRRWITAIKRLISFCERRWG